MKILDCLILAVDEGAKQGDKAAQSDPGLWSFTPFVLIFLVFYFLILRPQSSERRRLNDMLGNLKKNDKVATVGGIVGIVMIADGKEITLKVDDNTRIKFLRTHIGQVLTDENSDEKK